MIPKVRPIPCPLCSIPVRPSALNKFGICPMCADSKRDDLIAHHSQASNQAEQCESEALKHYKRVAKGRAAHQKAAQEAEKAKELKAEKKVLTEIQREQASMELARRSLLHYTERRNPKYDPSWSHELVAGQIEEFFHAVERKESPRMIISLPSRWGKLLANQTLMLTANRGWTTHGDLQPGDYVFGLDGKPTRVLAVSPEHPCDTELSLSSGIAFQTHSNHEWCVFDKYSHNRRGAWKILPTSTIANSLTYGARHTPRYSVPNRSALVFPEAVQPVDPYVLGLFLADGTLTRNRITQSGDEYACMAEVERRGYAIYNTYTYTASNAKRYLIRGRRGRFLDELAEAGITTEKYVPDAYLNGNIQQRLDFLAGLIDGDGHVNSRGSIHLQITNKRLADAARSLAISLGYIVGPTHIKPACVVPRANRESSAVFDSYEKARYTVVFSIPPGAPMLPLVHEVKSTRLRYTKFALPTTIRGASPIENGPLGKCIQVEAPDGMYLAGESLIPTHNSELASISGPGWALGHWPHWRFVLASYSDVLPVEFSRNIRDQLQSPEFKKLFPSGARLNPTDSSVQAWSTLQGGALRAIGVGGGLLGFGADVVVIDDGVKSTEEANSPQALEKLWQWFSSVAYSRLLPGGGVLIIGQRMAVNDLVGRLVQHQTEEEKRLAELRADIEILKAESPRGGSERLDNEIMLLEAEADELDASMDRWRYLEYPALATQDEYYDKQRGEIMRLPHGYEPDPAWKPLRKRGEALHERRYSRSYLLKLKRANPRMFQAMYMLNPVMDEGAYFNVADFQRYPRGKHPKAEYMHVFCAWDLAIGTKQSNDYTVGVCGGMDWEGKLWLLELVRGKFGDVREVADLMIDMHTKWGASITGIEHTHISMALGPILKTRMMERNEYINLAEGKEKLVPTADKAVRARQLQGICRSGRFYVPEGEEYDDYVSEMTRFTSGGHDDAVDASSWLAILALRNPPPRKPGTLERAQERVRSWLEDLENDMLDAGRDALSFMES